MTIEITRDEVEALRQMLEFCDNQTEQSHKGYFSTTQGWVGRTLKGLLDRCEPKKEVA